MYLWFSFFYQVTIMSLLSGGKLYFSTGNRMELYCSFLLPSFPSCYQPIRRVKMYLSFRHGFFPFEYKTMAQEEIETTNFHFTLATRFILIRAYVTSDCKMFSINKYFLPNILLMQCFFLLLTNCDVHWVYFYKWITIITKVNCYLRK